MAFDYNIIRDADWLGDEAEIDALHEQFLAGEVAEPEPTTAETLLVRRRRYRERARENQRSKRRERLDREAWWSEFVIMWRILGRAISWGIRARAIMLRLSPHWRVSDHLRMWRIDLVDQWGTCNVFYARDDHAGSHLQWLALPVPVSGYVAVALMMWLKVTLEQLP